MVVSSPESLADKLIALGELSALTSVDVPRERLLALFASKLHALFRADAFAAWSYQPSEKTVTLLYGHDLSPEMQACCVRPAPVDLFPEAKLAIDGGAVWTTEDVADAPLFTVPETRRLLGSMGVRSVLAVPLRALTRVLGALTLYYRAARGFTTDEKALAVAFANALALSLNNIEAYERLVISERIKSEVIDIVAHQFRTPLATLRGNVELLADESLGGDPKTRVQLIAELRKVGTRLLGYVESFLNVKRIDEGRLAPVFQPTDPHGLVQSVVRDLDTYREQHHIRLTLQPLSARTTISVDANLVRDALANVIGNAIKYAKTTVTVALRREQNEVVVVVEDDGVGIPSSEQPMIFQKLFRASNVAKSPEASSGLGLYIAKQYVEKNRGRIWFTSTEGRGSTFFLAFPVHDEAA